jgi:hypothetical protein
MASVIALRNTTEAAPMSRMAPNLLHVRDG